MKLSIRTKLIIAFTLILTATVVVDWRVIVGMNDIKQSVNAINTDQFIPARTIANANVGLIAWNRAILNHVLAENIPKMDQYEQVMLEQKTTMIERLQRLSELENLSDRGAELVRNIQDDFRRAWPIRDRVVALSRAGEQEAARQLLRTELRPIVDQIDAQMTEFMLLQERQLEQAIDAIDTRVRLGFNRIAWIIGGVLVLSLLISLLLARSIVGPVRQLIKGIEEISQGNLEYRIEVRSGDEIGRLATAFNDMTVKLRETQQQLVRQEKLAILGQLAGGVGHELRNPLGVITNAVYFLQMVLADADETIREYLEIIASEVHKAEKIVFDLLNFSRTRPVEREETAVSDLVAAVLESQPPPERVKVTIRIAPDLPPVFVDAGQIEQVLTNLVTNAYQAMMPARARQSSAAASGETAEGGKLTINAQAEQGQVHLSVTDTGGGISPENLEKIFEPLFTTKARGIGLGLVVSKNLVALNGGSLKVESIAGQGSTFTVTLPSKETV